jgi:hypothetical protein
VRAARRLQGRPPCPLYTLAPRFSTYYSANETRKPFGLFLALVAGGRGSSRHKHNWNSPGKPASPANRCFFRTHGMKPSTYEPSNIFCRYICSSPKGFYSKRDFLFKPFPPMPVFSKIELMIFDQRSSFPS